MENNDDSKNMSNVVSKTSSKKCQLNEFYFPEMLLLEILRRLPVKSIFMFKCVCMHWFSLISDMNFAQLYVSSLPALLQDSSWAKIYIPRFPSAMKSQPIAFVASLMYVDERLQKYFPLYSKKLDVDAYSGDNESLDVYSLPLPPTQKPEKIQYANMFGYENVFSMYRIVVVHLDIVLYASDKSCDQFYICNPFTGQWMELPPSSQTFRFINTGFITRVEDGMLMSFTVVRFNCPIETDTLNFEVFASETGEWESFDIFVGRVLELSRQRRPISLNGSLHWLLFGRNGILVYDPNNNPLGYRIIPLPDDNNEVDNTECFYQNFNLCAARGGCLSYIEVSESFNLSNASQHLISVWKLIDYDAGEWCLQHKVLTGDISADGLSYISPFMAIPVDVDPFCEDVLYMGCHNCVFSYNFQTRKLKAHGIPQLAEEDMFHRYHTMNFPCWRFVSLLAPIPTPTLIPLPSSDEGQNLLEIPAEEAEPNSEII